MIKFVVKEGDFINVNGILFQVNDGNVTHLPALAKPTTAPPPPKPGPATDEKGKINLPECVGRKKGERCLDYLACKAVCKDIRDRIETAFKVVPEGYVKGGDIPTCFSSLRANKGRNCNICTDRPACSAIYDKVNAAKEMIPNGYVKEGIVPDCLGIDYKCSNECSYRKECTIIYYRVIKALETIPEGYIKEGPAVPAPVPECFSSMLPNRLGRCVHCAYSSSCKKACDNIVHTVSKALEPVPEGITPPCLGCIDQYIDKLSDGCVGCDSRELCIKTHYKIKNTKKVKPLPGCFSSINPSKASGCNPCSYNGQCKIAYIKIQNKERDMASICLGAVKESLLNAFPKTKTNTSLPWES